MEQRVGDFVLKYWGLMCCGDAALLCEVFSIPCFLIEKDSAKLFSSRLELLEYFKTKPLNPSKVPPRIERITPKFLDPELYLEVKLREMENFHLDGMSLRRGRTLQITRDDNNFKICSDIETTEFCAFS